MHQEEREGDDADVWVNEFLLGFFMFAFKLRIQISKGRNNCKYMCTKTAKLNHPIYINQFKYLLVLSF